MPIFGLIKFNTLNCGDTRQIANVTFLLLLCEKKGIKRLYRDIKK